MNARDMTDWQAYARVYDLIAEHNPAYQDLVGRYAAAIDGWLLAPGATALDVGAGTGNFSLALAARYPDTRVIHVDGNAGMNAFAASKAAAAGRTNVEIRTQDVDDVALAPRSVAAVTAVHALYAFPRPDDVVSRIAEWLAPGGRLFACDPGRVLDVGEWRRYILRETIRRRGIAHALRLLYRARAGARQNRQIARQQATGTYWLHTLDTFCRKFEAAGLVVVERETTYRGCSDLIVARKPSSTGVT